jgi:hypothetical protein
MQTTWRKATALALALVYTSTNVVLNAMAESNFWAERSRQTHAALKTAPQFASLPPALLKMPIAPVNPVVPRWTDSHWQVSQAFPKDFQDLINAVPQANATIQDVYYVPNAQQPVVLIQDVHLNPEAQTNIAFTLQGLIDQKQIGLVAIEGAFGPLPLEPFRTFPDKSITKSVAQSFLDNALLGAPSYVGITSVVEPPLIVGVDDRRHYDANVQAYLNATRAKPGIEKTLAEMERSLAEQKKKIFSPELRRFDDFRTAYHQGKMNLDAYVKQLASVDDVSDPALQRFLAASRMEKSLDFNKVESERAHVLGILIRTLNKSEQQDLMTQSLAYRVGRLGFGAYYAELKHLCETHRVSLAQSPAFADYIRYVLLSDGIKADNLFVGLGQLERSIEDRLAVTGEQKKLAAKTERALLTEKLLSFELTPREWIRYQKLQADSMATDARLVPFEQFYREADIRSARMLSHLSRQPSNGAVALVAGGFHTPEIADLLKSQKRSFIIVSPKITKVETAGGSAYLSVFAREKTPLEKLFEGEKLSINPLSQNSKPTCLRMLASSFSRLLNSQRVAIEFGKKLYRFHVKVLAKADASKDEVTLSGVDWLYLTLGVNWENLIFVPVRLTQNYLPGEWTVLILTIASVAFGFGLHRGRSLSGRMWLSLVGLAIGASSLGDSAVLRMTAVHGGHNLLLLVNRWLGRAQSVPLAMTMREDPTAIRLFLTPGTYFQETDKQVVRPDGKLAEIVAPGEAVGIPANNRNHILFSQQHCSCSPIEIRSVDSHKQPWIWHAHLYSVTRNVQFENKRMTAHIKSTIAQIKNLLEDLHSLGHTDLEINLLVTRNYSGLPMERDNPSLMDSEVAENVKTAILTALPSGMTISTLNVHARDNTVDVQVDALVDSQGFLHSIRSHNPIPFGYKSKIGTWSNIASMTANIFDGKRVWLNLPLRLMFGLALPVQEGTHALLVKTLGRFFGTEIVDWKWNHLWTSVKVGHNHAPPLFVAAVYLSGPVVNLLVGLGGLAVFNPSAASAYFFISNVLLAVSDLAVLPLMSSRLRAGSDIGNAIQNIQQFTVARNAREQFESALHDLQGFIADRQTIRNNLLNELSERKYSNTQIEAVVFRPLANGGIWSSSLETLGDKVGLADGSNPARTLAPHVLRHAAIDKNKLWTPVLESVIDTDIQYQLFRLRIFLRRMKLTGKPESELAKLVVAYNKRPETWHHTPIPDAALFDSIIDLDERNLYERQLALVSLEGITDPAKRAQRTSLAARMAIRVGRHLRSIRYVRTPHGSSQVKAESLINNIISNGVDYALLQAYLVTLLESYSELDSRPDADQNQKQELVAAIYSALSADPHVMLDFENLANIGDEQHKKYRADVDVPFFPSDDPAVFQKYQSLIRRSAGSLLTDIKNNSTIAESLTTGDAHWGVHAINGNDLIAAAILQGFKFPDQDLKGWFTKFHAIPASDEERKAYWPWAQKFSESIGLLSGEDAKIQRNRARAVFSDTIEELQMLSGPHQHGGALMQPTEPSVDDSANFNDLGIAINHDGRIKALQQTQAALNDFIAGLAAIQKVNGVAVNVQPWAIKGSFVTQKVRLGLFPTARIPYSEVYGSLKNPETPWILLDDGQWVSAKSLPSDLDVIISISVEGTTVHPMVVWQAVDDLARRIYEARGVFIDTFVRSDPSVIPIDNVSGDGLIRSFQQVSGAETGDANTEQEAQKFLVNLIDQVTEGKEADAIAGVLSGERFSVNSMFNKSGQAQNPVDYLAAVVQRPDFQERLNDNVNRAMERKKATLDPGQLDRHLEMARRVLLSVGFKTSLPSLLPNQPVDLVMDQSFVDRLSAEDASKRTEKVFAYLFMELRLMKVAPRTAVTLWMPATDPYDPVLTALRTHGFQRVTLRQYDAQLIRGKTIVCPSSLIDVLQSNASQSDVHTHEQILPLERFRGLDRLLGAIRAAMVAA